VRHHTFWTPISRLGFVFPFSIMPLIRPLGDSDTPAARCDLLQTASRSVFAGVQFLDLDIAAGLGPRLIRISAKPLPNSLSRLPVSRFAADWPFPFAQHFRPQYAQSFARSFQLLILPCPSNDPGLFIAHSAPLQSFPEHTFAPGPSTFVTSVFFLLTPFLDLREAHHEYFSPALYWLDGTPLSSTKPLRPMCDPLSLEHGRRWSFFPPRRHVPPPRAFRTQFFSPFGLNETGCLIREKVPQVELYPLFLDSPGMPLAYVGLPLFQQLYRLQNPLQIFPLKEDSSL